MSDELNENLNVEELSTEQKKKAINLQDLVYVKKYIDANHYSKTETDSMLQSKVEAEVANKSYSKSEINANHYTKTESDNAFYKKTDTVAKALNATNADNATNATNATNADHATNADKANYATKAMYAVQSSGQPGMLHTLDEKGALRLQCNNPYTDDVIPRKSLLWEGEVTIPGQRASTSPSFTEVEFDMSKISDGDKLRFVFDNGFAITEIDVGVRPVYLDGTLLLDHSVELKHVPIISDSHLGMFTLAVIVNSATNKLHFVNQWSDRDSTLPDSVLSLASYTLVAIYKIIE